MKPQSLTIGKKIAAGFGIVLALTAAIVLISYLGVEHIVKNAGEVVSGNRLDALLAQKELDHLNWAGRVNALLTDEKVTTLDVQTDDHLCAFGKWLYSEQRRQTEQIVPALSPLLKEIEVPHQHLHLSAVEIGRLFKPADTDLPIILAEREIDHLRWAAKIRDAFLAGKNSLDVETDPARCALGKWIHSDRTAHIYQAGTSAFKQKWDHMLTAHKTLHESAAAIIQKMSASREDALKVYEKETLPTLDRTLSLIEEMKIESRNYLVGQQEARSVYATKTIPALEAVQSLLQRVRKEAKNNIMTDDVMLEAAVGTQKKVTLAGAVVMLAGILMAFFIARGITGVLKRIATQMDEGAQQVAAASGQVSGASQSLAEGASEQAASIEETSSSLEEMSSMTRQNADNARQADNLMKEARKIVGTANGSMLQLTTSMEEISSASEETSKIIKTIDEIAFQTNLLALNAAVEAARAGEAGAGFAVVADEVRNLALRAAEAAKNTAALIEDTVKKVKAGGELVAGTNEAFGQVADSTSKVGELVGEIAAASSEQAQGIEQVNRAVVEMDKVTQMNAANAEESASAAEEMNAQAEHMKANVDKLVALAGGATRKNRHPHRRIPTKDSAAPADRSTRTSPGKSGSRRAALPARADNCADDDADFKNF